MAVAHAITLLDHDEQTPFARWILAAAIVLAAHVGLMATYVLFRSDLPEGVHDAPAVILDLAPVAVAPETLPIDIAPGPMSVEQEQQLPAPKVAELPKPELVVKPTPAENPEVVLPIEQPKPEVKPDAKPEEKVLDANKEERKVALVAMAPPMAKRIAPEMAAPRAGDVSTVPPSYIGTLMAHLNRFKQYPKGTNVTGVAIVSFSMDRNGRVLTKRVSKSSGSEALDNEALAMFVRAEPLPAFPRDMAGPTHSFDAPIRFTIR
jgi:protein TonB